MDSTRRRVLCSQSKWCCQGAHERRKKFHGANSVFVQLPEREEKDWELVDTRDKGPTGSIRSSACFVLRPHFCQCRSSQSRFDVRIEEEGFLENKMVDILTWEWFSHHDFGALCLSTGNRDDVSIAKAKKWGYASYRAFSFIFQDRGTSEVVYDNFWNQNETNNSNLHSTSLYGGKIIIHRSILWCLYYGVVLVPTVGILHFVTTCSWWIRRM